MSTWRDRDPTDWACLLAFVLLGLVNIAAFHACSSLERATDRMTFEGAAIGTVWAISRITERYR